MSDMIESIRWGSVLLTAALMGLIGVVHRLFIFPLEKRLAREANRSKMLQTHLQSMRVLEPLASNFLLVFASGTATDDDHSSLVKEVEHHLASVQVDPEILQALAHFISTVQGMMASWSTMENSAPTPTQMANLEHAYLRLSTTFMRVTERLASATG